MTLGPGTLKKLVGKTRLRISFNLGNFSMHFHKTSEPNPCDPKTGETSLLNQILAIQKLVISKIILWTKSQSWNCSDFFALYTSKCLQKKSWALDIPIYCLFNDRILILWFMIHNPPHNWVGFHPQPISCNQPGALVFIAHSCKLSTVYSWLINLPPHLT